MCLYSVPGPVGSVSSIMEATSAVILWGAPSYRPQLYPITRYEIGYHVLQSDNNCSMADANDINLQALNYSNSSSDSLSTTLNKLNANTCYIFVVRAHSSRGAGEWRVIANMTLQQPPQPPQPSTTSSPGSTTPGSSGSFATGENWCTSLNISFLCALSQHVIPSDNECFMYTCCVNNILINFCLSCLSFVFYYFPILPHLSLSLSCTHTNTSFLLSL